MSSLSVDSDTGIVFDEKAKVPRFQTIIGMEIHAQLDIPTKLFSSAPTTKMRVDDSNTTASSVAIPNSLVHAFDVAVPGILPVISQDAIHAAILTAAACQCREINTQSRFERKHYFYADLPLGYQITQQRWPLARNGTLKCRRTMAHNSNNKKKKKDEFLTVGIDRIQIEQDTGKTLSVPRTLPNGGMVTESLVDFNRAGCALVEIVFHPDIRSANDAATVVMTLRNLLRHVGTCDGKMQEGSLRCDLNVSIAPIMEQHDKENGGNNDDQVENNPYASRLPPGTGNRVEVKNLNSFKQVAQAAEYEAKRQAVAFLQGNPTKQETRTFHVKTAKTVPIRTKEGAVDYRFLPEPDLPMLVLDKTVLNGQTLDEFIESNFPELPGQVLERLMGDQYGLSRDLASLIVNDKASIEMFQQAVETAKTNLSSTANNKKAGGKKHQIEELVAKLLCNNLYGLIKQEQEQQQQQRMDYDQENNDGDESDESTTVQYSKVTARQLGELVALILDGTLTNQLAKQILVLMYQTDVGKSPQQVADERGWKVISDMTSLQQLCRNVMEQHPQQVEQYKLGGKHVIKMKKFFIGKIMAACKGNADPELLRDALQIVLGELTKDDDDDANQ